MTIYAQKDLGERFKNVYSLTKGEFKLTDSNKHQRQQRRQRSRKKKHMWPDEKIKHNWLLTPTIKAIKRWKPTKHHHEIKSFPSPFMPQWHLTAEKPDHQPPASVSKRQALPQDAALCGRLIFVVHFNRDPCKRKPKKTEEVTVQRLWENTTSGWFPG